MQREGPPMSSPVGVAATESKTSVAPVTEPAEVHGGHDGAADTAQGTWFVLHTRSRQEKALAADLHAMSIAHYLPLVSQVRYYGRRKQRVQMPLFPGYLFLRGTLDEAFAADRTRRVVQLLQVSDQAQLARELGSVQLALEKEAPLDPYPSLAVGTLVEVRSGPFKGVRGIVEDRIRPERLLLQIQALGQGASLEIDGALLEPVELPDGAPAPAAPVMG